PRADDLILGMIQEPRGAIARALTEFDLKPSKLKALVADRPTRSPRPQVAPTPQTTAPEPPQPRQSTRKEQPRPERQVRSRARPEQPVVTPASAPEEPSPSGPRQSPKLDVERGSWFRWSTPLYLAVPVAVWLYLSHADPIWVLLASCLGVLPLAGLMGEATEQLA